MVKRSFKGHIQPTAVRIFLRAPNKKLPDSMSRLKHTGTHPLKSKQNIPSPHCLNPILMKIFPFMVEHVRYKMKQLGVQLFRGKTGEECYDLPLWVETLSDHVIPIKNA